MKGFFSEIAFGLIESKVAQYSVHAQVGCSIYGGLRVKQIDS